LRSALAELQPPDFRSKRHKDASEIGSRLSGTVNHAPVYGASRKIISFSALDFATLLLFHAETKNGELLS
jgi:hypothetical protein